ncbi:MAG TPA: SAM-dependent methyltransferase [Polyangiaceae bacterium]|nr:SAM-dependent methyltransferase [Polyangiaceae bacterium]
MGIGSWWRDYFERRFAVRDPWSCETSEYELKKYQRTIDVIPAIDGAEILEVGCAEGVFTARLAERCSSVLAVDICALALARARDRCAALPAARFARFDVACAPVIGKYDAIVCAEVLYYLHQRGLCIARDHLVSALKPAGHVVLVHPQKDATRVTPVSRVIRCCACARSELGPTALAPIPSRCSRKSENPKARGRRASIASRFLPR